MYIDTCFEIVHIFLLQAILRMSARQAKIAAAAGNKTPILNSPAGKAMKALNEKDRTAIQLKVRNAHFITKSNGSFAQYEALNMLDTAKGLPTSSTYSKQEYAPTFIHYIAEECRKETKAVLERGPFFSVIIDGTTNFMGVEFENMYIRSSAYGRITTAFQSIGCPEHGTGQGIKNFIDKKLEEGNLDKKRMCGLTADGAAVMQGVHTGVVGLLKEELPELTATHCLGHNVELGLKDCVTKSKSKKAKQPDAQVIALYDKVQTLLMGAYYFFRKSGKQTEGLRRVFKALHKIMARPKRVGGTRWATHIRLALETFLEEKNYKAFVFHWSTASNKPESNAKAEGLCRLAMDVNVVSFMVTLLEGLKPISALSLRLQTQNLSLGEASVAMGTCLRTLKSLHAITNPEVEGIIKEKKYKVFSKYSFQLIQNNIPNIINSF